MLRFFKFLLFGFKLLYIMQKRIKFKELFYDKKYRKKILSG